MCVKQNKKIQRCEAGTIDNTKKLVLKGLSEALPVSVEQLRGGTDKYETDIMDAQYDLAYCYLGGDGVK